MRLRDNWIFPASGVAMRGFGFVSAMALRAIVVPVALAPWTFSQLIVEFAVKFDLGVDAALARDIPLARGREDGDAVVALQATAFALSVLQAFALALLVLLYRWVAGPDVGYADWFVWWGAAAVLAFQGPATTGQAILNSHGLFDRAGVVGIVLSVVKASFLVAGAWVAGARGIVLGAAGAAALSLVVVVIAAVLAGIPLRLDKARGTSARQLLGFGLPLRVADYPSAIFTAIDALAIASAGTADELAIYGTARLVLMVSSELASRLAAAERMRWRVEAGRDGDLVAIEKGSLEMLWFIGLVCWPVVAIASYFSLYAATWLFIPDYVGALAPLRILLVAWLFLPHAYGVRDVWVVGRRFGMLLVSGLLGIGVFLGAWVSISYDDNTMLKAAASFLIAACVYMTFLLLAIGRSKWSRAQTAASVAALAVASMTTWGLTGVLGVPPQSIGWAEFVQVGGRGLMCVTLVACLFPAARWATRTAAALPGVSDE